ncbi:beta-ketoacyl synthase N-terminal-like domain-containing protein [Nostoc sp. UHCC 0302]|uniref:beta-ketoacyl synthase N-terminal-like domain-containing protein n=1 Tax=Nostoc sp. UHCC 0302 TaxID=3134896 RepID=UPI00311CC489
METIAIIGMGCRFPGAKDPESFWELLHQGVNAVTKVPPERWEADAFYDPNPTTPAKMNTRWGGFVEDIEKFDASFFNISPRETEHIDPQQRLVLEVAWEALENAGIIPDKLAGTQTGVFIGIGSYDYHNYVCSDLAALNAYSATGTSNSVAANRLSYLLDLRGPSVAIDTACSSSLVAVHYACQSLRLQETDLCIVGGVNIVLTTDVSITLSHARMMSPDGSCKTFDKNADGYVRGEGCGVVVLKRLADACKDGDKIIGVIKGSAVNQDGLSNGLTAPNGPAQQIVIQKALDNAGVIPADISYVEAHGTGTSLGDPIEVRALGAVFAKQRLQDEPLFIGSVKTNIGHLEAAAGMAGLIKVVLALQHETIPPNLHFQEPSPYINWAELPAVTIPTEPTAWLRSTKPRLAGVSSFGFGGTNAHVVLAEAPVQTPVISEVERDWHLLTLSAKNETALRELAQKYEKFLSKNSQASLADICFTANTSRTRFDYRLSVVAASNLHLREQLNAFVANEKIASLVSGKITGRKRQKIAFLFTGQGSQYIGMGRQFYEQAPVFRQTLQKCDEILRPYLEESIINILYPSDRQTSLIDQTAYTQPALFALEYSLYQLWQSWGVKPNALIGHSVGEYVAACIAGVFSLEDGLKLIAIRGRLMQGLPTTGEMVAVMASADEINNIVNIDESQVALAKPAVGIAAYNSPNNTVISGDSQAIQAISATLKAAGIKTTRLQTSHAFHSPLMQPILAEFQQVAATVTYNSAQIDIISNVTGEKLSPTAINAEYWCEHLRSSVKFADSIATLHQQGYEIFVELGAKPTLLSMGRSCLANSNTLWLASLRPGQEDWQTILDSLGQLYVRGVAIAWSEIEQDYSRGQVTLPTYPFQRQRYWPEIRNAAQQVASANNPQLHPLLGRRIHSALKEIQFESQISPKATVFLQQHQIFGKTVLPATAYIEMVLAAGQQILPSQQLIIEDISIQQALLLTDKPQTLQLILTPTTAGAYSWQIFCQNITAENTQPTWTLQVTGKLRQAAPDIPSAKINIANLLAECSQQISLPEYYEQFRQRGVDYGESFQGISQLWQHAEFALGEIHLPEGLQKEAQSYQLHPALLDACLQVLAAALPAELNDYSYMTVGIQQLRVYQQLTHPLWSCAKFHPSVNDNHKILTGDIELLNLQGEVIAIVEGLQLQQVGRQANEVWENLPTPAAIKAQLQLQLAPIIAQTKLENYTVGLSHLESLSIAYVLEAFAQLGWCFSLRQQFTVETLIENLGIDSLHLRLLARLLEMLAEVGILQQQQAQWQVQKLPELIKPQSQMNWLLTNYPIVNTELTLLERCGSQLASVLRGKCDPLQLLFPGGDFSITAQLYEKSPVAQVMNILVQKVLVTVLAQISAGRKLRILEIGAGTGGTTSHILPYLSPNQVEYTFTDVSPIFLFKAQQKFQDYPFVRYQILDIEQDPLVQEFAAQQYDVIVAANVLHVAGNLRDCVKNIKQLLAPGGMLVLLEGTQPQRWLDLIFGLTKGWWQFKDLDLRPAYPLLSSYKWQQLLIEAGFSTVETLPGGEDSQGTLSKQTVIVAQVDQMQPQLVGVVANYDFVGERREYTKFTEQPTADLELLHKLKTATVSESYLLITDYIQSVTSQVLGLSQSSLDVQLPLSEVGIDSLMAMELRLNIQKTLDVDVPIVKFIEGLSVASLAIYVSEQVAEAQSQTNVSLDTVYAFSQSEKNGSENRVITISNAENKVWFGEETIGDSEWIEGEI